MPGYYILYMFTEIGRKGQKWYFPLVLQASHKSTQINPKTFF